MIPTSVRILSKVEPPGNKDTEQHCVPLCVFVIQLFATSLLIRYIIFSIICFLSVSLSAQQSVPLKPARIYDFSGAYLKELGPGRTVEGMFDGFGTHDPKNNNRLPTDTMGASTGMIPYRGWYMKDGLDQQGNYYAGKRGWLMMFDMVGDKDMFKKAKLNITDIYGLQHGGDFQDTMFFYNGDKIFEEKNNLQRIRMLSRPDSLMKPFATLVMGHAIRYTPMWVGVNDIRDSMRYVYVRLISKNRGNYHSFPNFSELIFYGSARFPQTFIKPAPDRYNGPLPKAKPVGQMLGACNAGVFDDQLTYDRLNRGYQSYAEYDDENSTARTASSALYNFNANRAGASQWKQHYVDIPRDWGMYWVSIRGASRRLESQLRQRLGKPHLSAQKIIGVDEPFDEPEDPYSYERSGNFYRHFAKKWGYGKTPADTSYRFFNDKEIPGVNLQMYRFVENGNEDEVNLNKSILAYCIESSVHYDGHERRVPFAGIKLGDPDFELMYAGTTYLDSNRLAASIFLIRLIRDDHKVVWKYFSAHHYSRTYNHLDHSPTYEEMVGQRGESPEKDNLHQRLAAHLRALYKDLDGDTSHGYLLTEYGYDNWSTPSRTVSELAWGPPWGVLWSTSCTPIIPGFDSVQSKGIMMARAELIIASSHLAGYTEFSIMNHGYRPDNNNPGLFATCGRGGGGVHLPVKFANYWTRASLFTALKDYVKDSVYAIDSVGLCMIKFRHSTDAQKVCYAVWKGSYAGTALTGVSIPVGAVSGAVTRKSLSFSSARGIEQVVPVNRGSLKVTVTEEPKFYFFDEKLNHR